MANPHVCFTDFDRKVSAFLDADGFIFTDFVALVREFETSASTADAFKIRRQPGPPSQIDWRIIDADAIVRFRCRTLPIKDDPVAYLEKRTLLYSEVAKIVHSLQYGIDDPILLLKKVLHCDDYSKYPIGADPSNTHQTHKLLDDTLRKLLRNDDGVQISDRFKIYVLTRDVYNYTRDGEKRIATFNCNLPWPNGKYCMEITELTRRRINHAFIKNTSGLFSHFYAHQTSHTRVTDDVLNAAKLDWLEQYAKRMPDAIEIEEKFEHIKMTWKRSAPSDFVVINVNERQ